MAYISKSEPPQKKQPSGLVVKVPSMESHSVRVASWPPFGLRNPWTSTFASRSRSEDQLGCHDVMGHLQAGRLPYDGHGVCLKMNLPI